MGIPSDLTAMKKLLLLVGLLIALVAFVSGDSDKEDETYFQEHELDLLDRNLRNADPKRREQSGKIKSQREEKKRQRNKDGEERQAEVYKAKKEWKESPEKES